MEDKINLNESEIENQEGQYIDINELADQLQQMNLNPIELPIDNLQDIIEYDKDEFVKGVKSMSFMAGQLTALINSGITKEDAVTILVNKDNINHAKMIQQMINDNNVQVAEKQSIRIDNAQI